MSPVSSTLLALRSSSSLVCLPLLFAVLSGACSATTTHDDEGADSNEEGASSGSSDSNDPNDDGSSGSSGGGNEEEERPHALGMVTLGESHAAGGGTATPIVTAAFVPSAGSEPASCSSRLDGCELFAAPDCGSSCGQSEICVWSATCAPVCERVPVCAQQCDEDEVCRLGSGSQGECVAAESFDAGPLAFGGTTTPLTLYPPYRYSGDGEGAPFLAGTEIRVQAQGASGAGFESFDETFVATTFLQTTPALDRLTRQKVFGTEPLALGWAPGADRIRVTLTGPHRRAECRTEDAPGRFDVPRAVLDRVMETPEGGRDESGIMVTVARERTEVRKGKRTRGTLQSARIEPEGWLHLTTVSSESSLVRGCGSEWAGSSACGNECVDLRSDPGNCGSCGNACGSDSSCRSGTCRQNPPPEGAENTLEACSDGISNDGDSYIDCNDYDCCDVRSCPSGTACTP